MPPLGSNLGIVEGQAPNILYLSYISSAGKNVKMQSTRFPHRLLCLPFVPDVGLAKVMNSGLYLCYR